MQHLVTSLQIFEKTQDRGISNFQISGQSLINKNCLPSTDINMKLGPLAKPYNRNTTTSKKIDDDVMSINYNIIVIFPIYD